MFETTKQPSLKILVLPISAGLSGIVEACSTHPIDRVKTEMQRLALEKRPSGIFQAIGSIYSGDKLLGFYKGLVPRIVGIMPMRLVYWGTLNSMNEYTANSGVDNRFFQFVLPGMVAGAVQSVVDNPIEVFKTKLMTGASHVQWNRRLYDGFTPLICRNVIFAVCVGFSTKVYGRDHPFFSAAIGGMLGSIVSQPLDVIKTEMQRHRVAAHGHHEHGSMGIVSIAREVYQSGGISRLFAGTTMRCSLGFANMGIGFMVLSNIRGHVAKALE